MVLVGLLATVANMKVATFVISLGLGIGQDCHLHSADVAT